MANKPEPQVGEVLTDDIVAPAPLGLTMDEIKAKLIEVSDIRERTVAEIERLTREHAAMVSNLTGVDGALQVLGQLVEAVEAKGAA